MSRHRGAKRCRRYGLLGTISLLSPAYLLSVERWPFHSGNGGHLQLRLGYAINRYLAIEAEGSLAVLKPELRNPAEGSRLILDRYVAAFAVARLPVGDRVTLHGRGGYYTGAVPLEAQGARETENFDDFAYGLGLSYHWDHNAIRADYTVLTSSLDGGEGPKLDHRLIGIAFVRSF